MGAALVAAVAVAAFLYTREESEVPTRFRATMSFRVPSTNPEASNIAAEDVPREVVRGQVQLATSEEVRQAAVAAAGLDPAEARVGVSGGLGEFQDVMTVTITSENRDVTESVARRYPGVVTDARREVVAQAVVDGQQGLLTTIESLRTQLGAVESQLRAQLGDTLPPLTAPAEAEDGETPAPTVPANLPLETELLLFERAELARTIVSAQLEYVRLAVRGVTPSAYAELIEVGGVIRIDPPTSSPLVPVAGIIGFGLLAGIGGAVLRDRADHSIRRARPASTAFAAPVLSTIPVGRTGRLARPGSVRSNAYRSLATTSIATDRLPAAILVSAPHGRAHEDVAANFAAALAGLGLRVALISTSPGQEWFRRSFAEPEAGSLTLPDLLAQAHAGRLNGEVRDRLPRMELSPNLVLVPPGADPDLGLRLDGLPPLLESLANGGVEVTVIAGPALLDDANATIVAWVTRSVLWVCESGVVTEDEARKAAERLDLAGATPFGVVMVGEEP